MITAILRLLFPYRMWLRLRKDTSDWKGRLCYCGHTYKCSCADPDRSTFKEHVAHKNIILWDPQNGWKIDIY